MIKNHFEFKRQIAHIFLGLISLLLLYVYGRYALYGLLITALGFLFLAFLNEHNLKIPLVNYLVKTFERVKYKNKFPGKGFFFLFFGISLTYIIFPRDIAFASIIILTLGDSFSTLAGLSLGKNKIYFKKTIEGSLFGFVFSFLGAIFFVSWQYALFASFTATIIEVVTPDNIDDNLLIPIFSGFAMMLLKLI
jgi:dolichol kinase